MSKIAAIKQLTKGQFQPGGSIWIMQSETEGRPVLPMGKTDGDPSDPDPFESSTPA